MRRLTDEERHERHHEQIEEALGTVGPTASMRGELKAVLRFEFREDTE